MNINPHSYTPSYTDASKKIPVGEFSGLPILIDNIAESFRNKVHFGNQEDTFQRSSNPKPFQK